MRNHLILGAVGAIFLTASALAVTGGRGISQQGTFLQSGTGATLRTIEAELRDTVKASQFGTLQQAVDATPAGGTLYMPNGYSASLSAAVTISKNISIVSDGAPYFAGGPTLNAAANTAIFSLSGTIQFFRLSGLELNGSGTSKVLDFTGTTSSDGWIIIENNRIESHGSIPLTTGTSTYYVTIRNNFFSNNVGCVSTGPNSDVRIENNKFENPQAGSTPCITAVGPNVDILANTFIPGGTGVTGEDIRFSPTDNLSGFGGYAWVHENKFGAEGETTGRVKVRCYNATAANICAPVEITNNHFFGVAAGTKAIQFSNPITRWLIDGNAFVTITTVVDDVQNISGQTTGQSTFGRGNRFFTAGPWTLFTNGGRQFEPVYVPNVGKDSESDATPRDNETIGLRNRIPWSEDMSNAAWVKNGVSVTTGQADPYGTTRGMLLTRANAAQNENISIFVSDNTGNIGRFVVKFWAKSGSVSTLLAGVFDNTTGGFTGQLDNMQLGSGWKQYKLLASGITPTDSFSFYVYPKDTSQSVGTVSVCCVQISDYDSDYVVTAGSTFSDSTFGNRWSRGVQIATRAVSGRVVLTYSATIATDASLANSFEITATNGTAFTISNPSNLVAGQTVTYVIRNTSGGAHGLITWGATFKTAAAALTVTTAFSKSIEFLYNGTNLVETFRSAADVAN